MGTDLQNSKLLNELALLDELRTSLRAINAQLSFLQTNLDLLREKVDDAYYAVCSRLNSSANHNDKIDK